MTPVPGRNGQIVHVRVLLEGRAIHARLFRLPKLQVPPVKLPRERVRERGAHQGVARLEEAVHVADHLAYHKLLFLVLHVEEQLADGPGQIVEVVPVAVMHDRGGHRRVLRRAKRDAHAGAGGLTELQ